MSRADPRRPAYCNTDKSLRPDPADKPTTPLGLAMWETARLENKAMRERMEKLW